MTCAINQVRASISSLHAYGCCHDTPLFPFPGFLFPDALELQKNEVQLQQKLKQELGFDLHWY